jgi:integrase/recombinase XerD
MRACAHSLSLIEGYFLMTVDIPARLRSFLDYKIIERGLSENTRQSYSAALIDFFSFLDHKGEPATLEIRNYVASCFERKLSARTVAHRVSVLREFFKFLQADGIIRRDPMINVEAPKGWKRLPRYASQIEVQQLIDAPGPPRLGSGQGGSVRPVLGLRDRAICETFYASAIRVSELVSIKLLDLSLDRGLVTVFGKGSKERLVPLGRPAIDALRAYLIVRPSLRYRGSPYLFISYRSPRLTRQAICCVLRARARRAGIAHVYPHLLRHSAATHMLGNGANLRVIQEILGHIDIGTTEIYAHVSTEHVTEVFRKCHPRNNPNRAQMWLFPAPSLAPGFDVCVQCRDPVCSESKCYCSMHLQLANAASLRSRLRKKEQSSTLAHRRASGVHLADGPQKEGEKAS